MTYQRFWDERTLYGVFPVEALSKSPEVFEQTHVAIDRILVDKMRQRRVKYRSELDRGREKLLTDEQSILDAILNHRPEEPNRLILLVGQTGSGKSELCQ